MRELANVVERAVASARGHEITADDLSPVLHGARPEESTASALIPGATLFEIEREAILRTLDQCGGSTARAAEVLGVSIRKIQYRLKEYRSGGSGRRSREAAPRAREVASRSVSSRSTAPDGEGRPARAGRPPAARAEPYCEYTCALSSAVGRRCIPRYVNITTAKPTMRSQAPFSPRQPRTRRRWR